MDRPVGFHPQLAEEENLDRFEVLVVRSYCAVALAVPQVPDTRTDHYLTDHDRTKEFRKDWDSRRSLTRMSGLESGPGLGN